MVIILCDYIFIGNRIRIDSGVLYIDNKLIDNVPNDLKSDILKGNLYIQQKGNKTIINNYEYNEGKFKKTIYACIKYLMNRW